MEEDNSSSSFTTRCPGLWCSPVFTRQRGQSQQPACSKWSPATSAGSWEHLRQ